MRWSSFLTRSGTSAGTGIGTTDASAATQAQRPANVAALVASGLRNVPAIIAEHPDALCFDAPFSCYRKPDAIDPWKNVSPPPGFALPLSRNWACAASARVFSPEPMKSLEDLLLAALGPATVEFKAAADRTVEQFGIAQAHVCDHLFFESSLVAQAVRDRGGSVVLWPHSSNAVHTHMYRQGEVAGLRCVVQTARQMENSLPDTPCVVNARSLIQPCYAPRWSNDLPLHVVVFGAAYAMNRWPILDRRRHEDATRRLFRGLASMKPKVRTFFKAKEIWETTQWLKGLLDGEDCFEETLEFTATLQFPNMIFLSVCFGSTALLEGSGAAYPA